MKFSRKMCFTIILKVTKKQVFHLLLRRYIFQKTTGGSIWPPPGGLGLIEKKFKEIHDNKNPEKIVDIVKKILNFNNQKKRWRTSFGL